jgi:hypothetical protein
MTRLEKIILEQTRKSKPGTIGQTVSTDAVNQKAKQLKAMSFLLYYVFGKKESPIDKRKVASVLPKISIYGDNSIYSRGEYFYVIGEDYKENEGTNKAVIYYPIYIIRQSESDIESLNKFMIGGTTIAPIIDINDFQNIQDTIKKKKADAEAAAIAAAEKKKPAIEITKDVVQNVVNGTETINVNNLGKGTKDAKAFQELLYLVGLKLIPGYTSFKRFVSSQLEAPDGGWAGDIGDLTLAALHQINGSDKERLTVKWNAGDKAGVIEELRKTLATVNESTNYFKGTGINTKLKDLIKEHLINEQGTAAEEEVYVPTNSTTTVTTTTKTTPTTTNTKKKTSSTNFTQATFPSKYNGSGTITYNNGDKFTGSWVNGLKTGKGKFTKFDTGITIEGEWKAGKKNGIITFTFKDGTTTQQTWKDNETYWSIAKNWVIAEYNFWEGSGTGPEGQKRPVTHKNMFDQFNATGFGNFIGDDNEVGAKNAYLANRKVALKWLDNELAGCVAVTGQDYYSKIKKWIYDIADEIADVFQNDQTIELTNDAEGDTITRTVQGEIDVDW